MSQTTLTVARKWKKKWKTQICEHIAIAIEWTKRNRETKKERKNLEMKMVATGLKYKWKRWRQQPKIEVDEEEWVALWLAPQEVTTLYVVIYDYDYYDDDYY